MRTPIPILMYHSIADDPATGFARWAVSPAAFDDHMRMLTEEGYRSMTVSQLVAEVFEAGRPLPPRSVVITFDDGLGDFAASAVPSLLRHGMTATLYVPTAFVGATSRWLASLGEGRRPMLTWTQLRAVHEAGIEVGAHSHAHPELDTLPRHLAAREIVEPKRRIEDELGVAVDSFAYPHGYHSPRVVESVRRAGYRSACQVAHALADTRSDRFALPRLIVSRGTDTIALAELLAGEGCRTADGGRGRRAAWRAARRARRAGRRGLVRRDASGDESHR